MRNRFSMAAVAALLAAPTGAWAAELPTFEVMGFPITAHQFSVIGPAYVAERSPDDYLLKLGPERFLVQWAANTPNG